MIKILSYVLGGLFVTGSIYAGFVYLPDNSPEPESQVATVSGLIAQGNETECPTTECPSCLDCSASEYECEPEIVVKDNPLQVAKIKSLEQQIQDLLNKDPEVKVVIKEVPVEVIKEVEVIREVIREVPVERIVVREIVREVYLPRQCPSCPTCQVQQPDQQLKEQKYQELESINQQITSVTNQINEEIKEVKKNPWLTQSSLNGKISDIQGKYALTLDDLYWQRQQIIDWLSYH